MRLTEPPFRHIKRRTLTIFSVVACLGGMIGLFVGLWLAIKNS